MANGDVGENEEWSRLRLNWSQERGRRHCVLKETDALSIQ